MGILGIALEHTARVATAKPEVAAIFLIVNGFILIGAERLRRRSEVRALARREGMKADGGRRLDTLEYREAAVIGSAAVERADRRDQPRRRGDGRRSGARARQRGRRPLRLPAGDPDHPRRGHYKIRDLTGRQRQRDPRAPR